MDNQLIDVKADIRERLIHVAIRLFAEKGVDAVPLRTISAEAGSKNKSAVHYHFGSKLGIIEAIFETLQQNISNSDHELLTVIEQRAELGKVSVSEVLIAFYLPLFIIKSSKSYGPNAIKLLAKMMLDCNPEYQSIYKQLFRARVSRIYKLIKRLLPHKPEQDLRFQLMHGLMAATAGLATTDLMEDSPIGDIRFNNEYEMLISYVSYVTGGLTNEQSCINLIDNHFWLTFFHEKNIFQSVTAPP